MSTATDRKMIAILLATYNGERYLAEQLQSLCKQTRRCDAIFVRDDKSTDSTIDIVNTFEDQLPIIWIPANHRAGPKESFRLLLSAALQDPREFEYILYCDQDDVWNGNKIEIAISELSKHPPETPTLYASAQEIVASDLSHKYVSGAQHVPSWMNAPIQNIVTGCTMGLNRSGATISLTDSSDGYVMHDWWAYLVISHIGTVLYDQQPRIKYRQHGSNAVGANNSWVRRLLRAGARLFSGNSSTPTVRTQAKLFLSAHEKDLSMEQASQISLLACDGSLQRLQFAFKTQLHRQTRIETALALLRFIIWK
jgi:glycosyltransferase involved in cell wall biosynthesis